MKTKNAKHWKVLLSLSNSELAKLLKVHPSTVRRWKTGEISMSKTHAQLFAIKLGIPFSLNSVFIWEQED